MGHSKETIEKIRETVKRQYQEGVIRGFKKGHPKLKKTTKGDFKKGMIPWNKGIEWKRMQGSNNPTWKGGYDNRYGMGKWKWQKLSDKIMKRDNFICQDCKKEFDKNQNFSKFGLTVHHIIPYLISKDNNPKNLITFCRSCHIERHRDDNNGRTKS